MKRLRAGVAVGLAGFRRARDAIGKRSPVGTASILTGFAAYLGILLGGDSITWVAALRGVPIGAFSGIAVWLVEKELPSTQRRRTAIAEAQASSERAKQQPTQQAPPAAQKPRATSVGPIATFRGRREQLETLRRRHDQLRHDREESDVSGAVLLMIHGMPGVGKSALAAQLRRELEPLYPGGTLYANFGVAGGRRPPADIVKTFLAELGRPVSDSSASVQLLVDQFRSITVDKQLLFVFDAARDHDQVRALLPTGPGCAVIVTSRRDLSPALNEPSSLLLETPHLDDALDILSAHSGVSVEADPDAAIELVNLCGRLPMAIVAAADRIAVHGTDIRHVTDTLRLADTRLELLEHSGRSVRERITSEMDRLTPQLRRALGLLTVVPAPTFMARVLAPLLDVRVSEAEDLMATLAETKLVADAGVDEAVGMPRYRLNSIVRLVCNAERRNLDPTDLAQATERFFLGYLSVVADIGRYVEGAAGDEPQVPFRSWVVTGHSDKYSTNVEYAVRLEYLTLVRAAQKAFEQRRWGLCWRIAARLRGCVPEAPGSTLKVFSLALRAAQSDNDPLGEIAVLLAEASYLIAVEYYPRAFACLESANSRAETLIGAAGDADVVNKAVAAKVRAYRMLAEAYVQMGAYDAAATYVELTSRLAATHGIADEAGHIALLRADTHRVTIPMPKDVRAGVIRGSDPLAYHVALVESESARRRHDWPTADSFLDQALLQSKSDVRRTANVHYRQARLALDQCTFDSAVVTDDGDEGHIDTRAHARRAIRRASAAAVAFRRMGNQVGLVRAHCLLIRAHAAADNIVEAEQLLHEVMEHLVPVRQLAGPAYLPLLARFAFAQADLLAARGDADRAWTAYMAAATLYAAEHDWTGRQAAMLSLARRDAHGCQPHGASPEQVDAYLMTLTRRGAPYSATPRHMFSSEFGIPEPSRNGAQIPRQPTATRSEVTGT